MDWFEDDQFWLRFGPIMFDAERWSKTPWEVEGILSMLPIAGNSAVLDSCCGPGRHSLEFARRGYRVTGVDRTGPYIDAARESAEAEEVSIEFLQQDVRYFRRPETYVLALNLFTSFGFFSDPDEEKQYIDNILDSLVPGGHFIIDVNGKELIARDFTPLEEYDTAEYTVRGEYAVLDDYCTLQNIWTLHKGSDSYSFRFSHRIYSAAELKELLISRGFSTVTIIGGFDGRPYDQKAERLIAIARK